jgi:hypothetical protein
MKKLMVLAALLATALAAAPALAEDVPVNDPDTTVGGPPGEGPPGTTIGGAPGEGPKTLLDCATLKAAGADVSCDPARSLPPLEDQVADSGKVPAQNTSNDTPPAEHTSPDTAGDAGNGTAEATDESETVKDTGNDTATQDTKDQQANSDEKIAKDQETNSGDKTGDNKDTNDHADKTGDPKQVSDQEADSGNVDQSVGISNTGDNVNMCIGVLQAANTGNSLNQQGVLQDNSEADKVELAGGGSITLTPQLVVDCRQVIFQIVTGQQPKESNTNLKAAQRKSSGAQVLTNGAQIRAVRSEPKPVSTMADARAAQRPNATPRALPRTGGISSLDAAFLGLCAGAPLIGGGLLVRRIFR